MAKDVALFTEEQAPRLAARGPLTMQPARWNPWVPAIGLLMLLAGCGSDKDLMQPVHGQVLYKGVPLTGGTIVFTPDPARGGIGPLANAEIQQDGRYVLRTGDRLGAMPGWHRVTIVALDSAVSPPQSLLPDRYRDPDLSGLSAEIRTDRENTLNFNME